MRAKRDVGEESGAAKTRHLEKKNSSATNPTHVQLYVVLEV